jgi:hypothetical protein
MLDAGYWMLDKGSANVFETVVVRVSQSNIQILLTYYVQLNELLNLYPVSSIS